MQILVFEKSVLLSAVQCIDIYIYILEASNFCLRKNRHSSDLLQLCCTMICEDAQEIS